MKKILLILLMMRYAYSIGGTITFYDGTTLEGELSSSDIRYVFIIPNGLVMPEKIPVVDIESLNLENGISLIEDGIAKQTYKDGKFSLIERKETEEIPVVAEEENYENYSLGILDYFSVNAFYGIPIYFRPSLHLEDGTNPTYLPNIGFNFQLPFFPVGPVNLSAGGRIITIGFDKKFDEQDETIKLKSITLAGIIFSDLQPIINLGENFHIGIETGLTYSFGWDANYSGGIGVVVGGNLDYWFQDSPLGVKLFGNGYMIPHPKIDAMTGLGNIGVSLMLALKRS